TLDPNILGNFGNESFLPNTSKSGPQRIRCGLAEKQNQIRTLDDWDRIRYKRTVNGDVLIYNGHSFTRRATYEGHIYWPCAQIRVRCGVYMITSVDKPTQVAIIGVHNHN
ncbi:hypothetical protein KR018_011333, partial [Drosophila ironensis]